MTEQNVTKAVAQSAELARKKIDDKSTAKKEDVIVEMENGVKFRVKEVPQFAYVDLRNSLPEPTPPIFYNPSTDREEPNPQDPRYKAQMSNWQVAMSSAITDINIVLGSEVIYVPKSIPTYDSDEFKEKLQFMLERFGWDKREIREAGKTTQYLMWVKYEAASGGRVESDGDLGKLLIAINRMSGVPEEDVDIEVDKFPD